MKPPKPKLLGKLLFQMQISDLSENSEDCADDTGSAHGVVRVVQRKSIAGVDRNTSIPAAAGVGIGCLCFVGPVSLLVSSSNRRRYHGDETERLIIRVTP